MTLLTPPMILVQFDLLLWALNMERDAVLQGTSAVAVAFDNFTKNLVVFGLPVLVWWLCGVRWVYLRAYCLKMIPGLMVVLAVMVIFLDLYFRHYKEIRACFTEQVGVPDVMVDGLMLLLVTWIIVPGHFKLGYVAICGHVGDKELYDSGAIPIRGRQAWTHDTVLFVGVVLVIVVRTWIVRVILLFSGNWVLIWLTVLKDIGFLELNYVRKCEPAWQILVLASCARTRAESHRAALRTKLSSVVPAELAAESTLESGRTSEELLPTTRLSAVGSRVLEVINVFLDLCPHRMVLYMLPELIERSTDMDLATHVDARGNVTVSLRFARETEEGAGESSRDVRSSRRDVAATTGFLNFNVGMAAIRVEGIPITLLSEDAAWTQDFPVTAPSRAARAAHPDGSASREAVDDTQNPRHGAQESSPPQDSAAKISTEGEPGAAESSQTPAPFRGLANRSRNRGEPQQTSASSPGDSASTTASRVHESEQSGEEDAFLETFCVLEGEVSFLEDSSEVVPFGQISRQAAAQFGARCVSPGRSPGTPPERKNSAGHQRNRRRVFREVAGGMVGVLFGIDEDEESSERTPGTDEIDEDEDVMEDGEDVEASRDGVGSQPGATSSAHGDFGTNRVISGDFEPRGSDFEPQIDDVGVVGRAPRGSGAHDESAPTIPLGRPDAGATSSAQNSKRTAHRTWTSGDDDGRNPKPVDRYFRRNRSSHGAKAPAAISAMGLKIMPGAAAILMRTEEFPASVQTILGTASRRHQGELAVITARLQYLIHRQFVLRAISRIAVSFFMLAMVHYSYWVPQERVKRKVRMDYSGEAELLGTSGNLNTTAVVIDPSFDDGTGSIVNASEASSVDVRRSASRNRGPIAVSVVESPVNFALVFGSSLFLLVDVCEFFYVLWRHARLLQVSFLLDSGGFL